MSQPCPITSGIRALRAVGPSLQTLEDADDVRACIEPAIERGYFTPAEDAILRAWFARYLSAREALLEVITDLRPLVAGDHRGEDHDDLTLRAFVVGYTAAALLVHAGRILVADIASHKLTQRKLNEPDVRRRIPRKQFTSVYRSLTSPVHAVRLHDAIRFAETHRDSLDTLRRDSKLGGLFDLLDAAEPALGVTKRAYVKARLRYRWHSWRRRRASAAQQIMFAMCEGCGRVIAELRNPFQHKRVRDIEAELDGLLAPGDVMVTRHENALSNVFLPGYWPHVALHIGARGEADALGVAIDERRTDQWIDPIRVLEARKDGVLLRPLSDTLTVDAIAVIRPRLDPPQIARALSQALVHEGKLYNFDFDFFRADRLVCTEVVYRAFDGVGSLDIQLKERAGRNTLSAEDLLDLAIDHHGFEPIAVYGAPNCEGSLVTGSRVAEVLAATYRDPD